jgi:hypothetical protein
LRVRSTLTAKDATSARASTGDASRESQVV